MKESVTITMPPSSGVAQIHAERMRQIHAEGWTPEHDDKHKRYKLAKAAESSLAVLTSPDPDVGKYIEDSGPAWNWPWTKKWWKPSCDPIRNLVKAGALIAAEIDRLERLRVLKG